MVLLLIKRLGISLDFVLENIFVVISPGSLKF